jgi:hypothetical protein
MYLRRLTFDMRGAQKAQPFGHPLDGRVGRRCCQVDLLWVTREGATALSCVLEDSFLPPIAALSLVIQGAVPSHPSFQSGKSRTL